MAGTKRALLTGITGEIGSVLYEFLLGKGYEVHGIVRNPASVTQYVYHKIFQNAILHTGDLQDAARLKEIVEEVQPHEIYNLAAETQVAASWQQPIGVMEANFMGLIRLLDAIASTKRASEIRLLHAGSSEMYGQVEVLPINESTSIAPRTPYATSKAAGFWIIKNYRTHLGLFAANAILFNQECPRRGTAFSTYQMTLGASQVVLGKRSHIEVANLELTRDWGHAEDCVECLWLILQAEEADDYIISSGTGHTVRQFLEASFAALDHKITWSGQGVDEVGRSSKTGEVVVRIDPHGYANRSQSNNQVGDSSKARRVLGWRANKTFQDTVTEMTLAACEREKVKL
ncbi:hypothetical protein AC578_3666 [Pseudocercospora eumusae]|uniref:GDP-mannose 4,6-dehydratase n=1 Tax=Pseudocercospora eumusae TaxID=321146 RepID=A0A139GXB7_9PEZI|nr:hypothetical protein AC578_3666 [Pseudocercospora eumusae]